MARVTVVSPTQINTWIGDGDGRRKWAWQYIAKKPKKPSASADLGNAVHAQEERYLRGEGFDFSTPYKKRAAEIALLGVHLLPQPCTPGMRVENRPIGAPPGGPDDKDFRFEDSKGIVWRGRMDVTVPDSIVVPGLWGGAPACVDHKTSSNIAKYSLRDEDLHTDPQGVIYAYYLMSLYRSPVADLQWNYLPTKGPKVAQPRRLRVYSPRVVAEFGRIREHGSAIAATHREVTNPLQLPPCEGKAARGSDRPGDPCAAYGGCPFKEFCTDVFTPMGFVIDRQQVTVPSAPQENFNMNAPNGTPQGYATMAALQGQPVAQTPEQQYAAWQASQQPPAPAPAVDPAFLAWQASQQQPAPTAPPAPEPIPAWATSTVPYTGAPVQTAAAPQQFAQTATINGYTSASIPIQQGSFSVAPPTINDPASFQPPPTLDQRAVAALAPTGAAKKTRTRRTAEQIAADKAAGPSVFTIFVINVDGTCTEETVEARAVFVR